MSSIEPTVDISWTATESINHDHSIKWYWMLILAFVVVAALLVALKIFNVFDWMTTITTGIMLLAMLVAILVSTKKPYQEINYRLTGDGVYVRDKLSPYSDFRAFGVTQLDNGMWQLSLIPVKRFGMAVTIFIDANQGEQIVDELGAHLPMEEIKPNFTDKLIDRFKL